MKVYLAGKMSGEPGHGFPVFHAAAADLRERGYEVVNPAESPTSTDMEGIARGVAVVAGEDIEAVVVLPRWTLSKGARLEAYVAAELAKPILAYPEMESA